MDPEVIKKIEEETMNLRIEQEGLQETSIKIFSDVLEALIGAVFIDSECDMAETRRVIMKLIEPYLYVYGSVASKDSHPRTDAINLLAFDPIGNIRGHPIKISHFSINEKNDQGEMQTVYRGSIAGVDVVNMSFKLTEKSKQLKFYGRLHEFVKDFLKYMHETYQVEGKSAID